MSANHSDTPERGGGTTTPGVVTPRETTTPQVVTPVRTTTPQVVTPCSAPFSSLSPVVPDPAKDRTRMHPDTCPHCRSRCAVVIWSGQRIWRCQAGKASQ